MRIVLATEKLNFLDASCCNVEVMNGAAGDFLPGFFSMDATLYFALICSSTNFLASSSLLNRFGYSAIKTPFALFAGFNSTTIRYAEVLSKFFIFSSLSTISLTATDWTRPAERAGLTFFHNKGESSYPTNRSNTLLACWAETRFLSISLGD